LRLVVDTNVILKALIKDSVVRGIIIRSGHNFLLPEYAIEETREHLNEVAAKSGLSRRQIESVLELLLAKVEIVPAEKVASKWKEAEVIMTKIDRDDVPFVAAALGVRCDGIWSDDAHMRRQGKLRVWTTKEVAELSRT
jgi:predicted nucleic acid-binding protein